MNEFDVVIEAEDLLVLGPVDNVDLQVDIGPTGSRGSKFFVGYGDPNTAGVIPESEVVQIGDYFINSSVSGDYGWLYVYQAGQNNVISWVKAIRLQPSLFADNRTVSFTNGLGEADILISEITSDTSIINTNKYVAQVTPISADPMLVTVRQKRISAPNYDTLTLDLRAMKYISETWVPLDESLTMGINVSVV